MSPSIALVIGGADCVLVDHDFASALVGDRPHTVLVTNDMIADFPAYDVAVTLHPDKMPLWLARRARNGYPAPTVVWSHRIKSPLITNATPDWSGSVSLFAVKVALETGHSRVIVCGAPMTTSKHYLRKQPWAAAIGFRRGWQAHRLDIHERVRSCSGWTAELLGRPSAEWLDAPDK